MNEESKGTFTVIDENGKEIEYEVLFTFESEETHKSYIVYTDNTLDEEGNVKVFASIYNPEDEKPKLIAIDSEKEWKVIESILETIQEQVEEDSNKTAENNE